MKYLFKNMHLQQKLILHFLPFGVNYQLFDCHVAMFDFAKNWIRYVGNRAYTLNWNGRFHFLYYCATKHVKVNYKLFNLQYLEMDFHLKKCITKSLIHSLYPIIYYTHHSIIILLNILYKSTFIKAIAKY